MTAQQPPPGRATSSDSAKIGASDGGRDRSSAREEPGRRSKHGAGGSHQHGHAHDAGAGAIQDGVRDPVCGMTVDPNATLYQAQHAGQAYYFCSAGCAAKFTGDSEKYLTKVEAKPPQAVPEGTRARCIRKYGRSGRGRARSAGWRSRSSSTGTLQA